MKMPPLPGTYDDTRRDNTRVSSHRIESKWRIRSLCIFLCTNVDNTKRDTYVISLARVTRKKLTNDAPHLMHKWCFDSTPLGLCRASAIYFRRCSCRLYDPIKNQKFNH